MIISDTAVRKSTTIVVLALLLIIAIAGAVFLIQLL